VRSALPFAKIAVTIAFAKACCAKRGLDQFEKIPEKSSETIPYLHTEKSINSDPIPRLRRFPTIMRI
jgi:hypothetical protein